MITVVTVVYNSLDDLKYTVLDLMGQSTLDFELVIIDGNSTDGTGLYLAELKAKNIFKNLKIVIEDDLGIYDAMNKGVLNSTREYIVFMNAGDRFYSTNSIEGISGVLRKKKSDFVFGDTIIQYPLNFCYKKANVTFFDKGTHLHFDKAFSHQSLVCKRDILLNNSFDLNYPITADFKFYHRLLKGGSNFDYIRLPISVFATGGVSDMKRLSVHLEKLHFMRREYRFSIRILLHYFRVITFEMFKAPLRGWYRK